MTVAMKLFLMLSSVIVYVSAGAFTYGVLKRCWPSVGAADLCGWGGALWPFTIVIAIFGGVCFCFFWPLERLGNILAAAGTGSVNSLVAFFDGLRARRRDRRLIPRATATEKNPE
jgi:integral membrane sensor domain MASE1